MRIIGGIAGGRLLKVPKGFDVRPTPDLVKQALFNSLGTRVESARVLELFAGTGALALESLSRGALHATCIELSAKHARVIQHNLADTGLPASACNIRTQDAFTALAQLNAAGHGFDLVFADPPYGEKNVGRRSTSFAQKLLDDLNLPSLILPGGLLILGYTRRDTLAFPPPWREVKEMRHGDTMMRFLSPHPPAPPVEEPAETPLS